MNGSALLKFVNLLMVFSHSLFNKYIFGGLLNRFFLNFQIQHAIQKETIKIIEMSLLKGDNKIFKKNN
jgi:hypothetical protein